MDQIEIVEFPEAAPMPQPSPAKVDGRSKSSATNGAKGGCPEGFEFASKRSYPADALIEETAKRIMTGGRSPLNLRDVGPVTKDDMSHIARITGIPADEFVAKLTARLQGLADKTGDRIWEKLEGDAYKPEHLSYLYSVLIDKLTAISGRQQVSGANIGVQVNVITSASGRDEILAAIKKERTVTELVVG